MVLKRDKPAKGKTKKGGDSDEVIDQATEAFQKAGDEFNAPAEDTDDGEEEVSQDQEQGDAPDLASRVTELERQMADHNAYWGARRTDWPASLAP